jgi:hypothetical protein
MADRVTTPRKPRETITVNAKDITWIKEALTNLSNRVESIDKTTTKLNVTIVGDADYGQIGLITKVKELSEYIETDKNFKSKLVGGSIVLGTIWTAFVAFISSFISK